MTEKTLILRNDQGPVGQYITSRLVRLAAGHDPRVIVPGQNLDQSPAAFIEAQGPSAIILGGSLSSVTQHESWMEWEYGLIRETVARGIPILGLCFGHQAMAVALGGRVEKKSMTRGPNLIVPDEPTPLFAGVHDWNLVGTHEDHVTRLPEQFRRIASSSYCAIQGMQHENQPAFGVQFHPCYDHDACGVKELGLSEEQAYANPDGARIVTNFLTLTRGLHETRRGTALGPVQRMV